MIPSHAVPDSPTGIRSSNLRKRDKNHNAFRGFSKFIIITRGSDVALDERYILEARIGAQTRQNGNGDEVPSVIFEMEVRLDRRTVRREQTQLPGAQVRQER